jgi:hypothetical protein
MISAASCVPRVPPGLQNCFCSDFLGRKMRQDRSCLYRAEGLKSHLISSQLLPQKPGTGTGTGTGTDLLAACLLACRVEADRGRPPLRPSLDSNFARSSRSCSTVALPPGDSAQVGPLCRITPHSSSHHHLASSLPSSGSSPISPHLRSVAALLLLLLAPWPPLASKQAATQAAGKSKQEARNIWHPHSTPGVL